MGLTGQEGVSAVANKPRRAHLQTQHSTALPQQAGQRAAPACRTNARISSTPTNTPLAASTLLYYSQYVLAKYLKIIEMLNTRLIYNKGGVVIVATAKCTDVMRVSVCQ